MSGMKLDNDTLKQMLRTMLRIRGFETNAKRLYQENWDMGNFMGALHSYEGQEAVATGACACLRDDDYVFSTHRGHGHFIAKGGTVHEMMAELLGKEAGCSRGRGGSMHMFKPEKGLMGGNGIVGGGIPLALGPAFAAKYRGTDQVTVTFFGDGASSQGVFHESMNMAALWDLPVVYVCENNCYAVNTRACDGVCVASVGDRAAAYGCPGATVEGNDPLPVHEAVLKAVEHARAGHGPSLVEAKTYRMAPHCMVIRETRDEAELQAWAEKDPIVLFEARLQSEGVMSAEEVKRIEAEVDAELADAVREAIEAPYPDPALMAEDLWVG